MFLMFQNSALSSLIILHISTFKKKKNLEYWISSKDFRGPKIRDVNCSGSGQVHGRPGPDPLKCICLELARWT